MIFFNRENASSEIKCCSDYQRVGNRCLRKYSLDIHDVHKSFFFRDKHDKSMKKLVLFSFLHTGKQNLRINHDFHSELFLYNPKTMSCNVPESKVSSHVPIVLLNRKIIIVKHCKWTRSILTIVYRNLMSIYSLYRDVRCAVRQTVSFWMVWIWMSL